VLNLPVTTNQSPPPYNQIPVVVLNSSSIFRCFINMADSAFDIDAAIFYTGLGAAIFGLGLTLLATDSITQKIISPLRLYTRRRQQQLHKLDCAIPDSIFTIRTHVNEGNDFQSSVERNITEFILTVDQIKKLVKDICDKQNESAPVSVAPIIVGISKDLNIAKDQWYIHLAFPEPDSRQADGSPRYNRRVQVPIVAFCKELGTMFESMLTSYAMCFVADASSSLSSHVFSTIFTKCQSELQIPIIQEPAWMVTMALLIRRKAILMEDAERILFSLCRLESLRLQLQGKKGQKHKTVLFILPGQGCTKILLPMLQSLFPCERHVFAYDGCAASVQRGLMHLKKGHASQLPVTAMPRSITATIPLFTMMKDLNTLPNLLAQLPNHVAGIVEAWIGSVDALLSLKENEGKNMYTPFVCRMEFLLKEDPKSKKDGADERSILALTNVLQYITGSRSRALDDMTMDAAQSVLVDLREECQNDTKNFPKVDRKMRVTIEDCAFAHKMILYGDKTLPDTVIPTKEWSLKAGKKMTSCACCFPAEEDEEGSEADDGEVTKVDASSFGNAENAFVDGKMSFAFDPTAFTGMK